MGGVNPYIERPESKKATQSFTVKFLPMDVTVEVDPVKIPFSRSGQPGSLLDISSLREEQIELEHTCGGVCACSTCHVKVLEGLESCSEPTDDELDMLDEAPGLSLESRLGCQCIPDGTHNLVVEIPNWNRNAVKE